MLLYVRRFQRLVVFTPLRLKHGRWAAVFHPKWRQSQKVRLEKGRGMLPARDVGFETSGLSSTTTSSQGTERADQPRAFCVAAAALTPPSAPQRARPDSRAPLPAEETAWAGSSGSESVTL